MKYKRVVILNSYYLAEGDPFEFDRVKYFVRGLLEEAGEAYEFQFRIVNTNSLEEFRRYFRDNDVVRDADLVHAVGTPNAALAASYLDKTPIVYYGAHPEGVGENETGGANVCRFRLTLPFTSNHRKFRFIKKLLPRLKRLYVPFYRNTIFFTGDMKVRHDSYRKSHGGRAEWIPGESPHVAYHSLAGLCYIIGIEYREADYASEDELKRLLARVEKESAAVMPYNDTVYCDGAVKALLEFSGKGKTPLVWNNNPEATRVGALAAFSSCFKEAGYETGRMAGKILKGAPAADLEAGTSGKDFSSLNLSVAEKLGLDIPDQVQRCFTETVAKGAQ